MEYEDLYKGMVVRIIEWDYRPDHWSTDMDEWQGEVVTIDSLYEDGEVYIAEDEHAWQWFAEDFEFYHPIPADNPNRLYTVHKHNKWMEKIRLGAKK
jgi:hypothetical protein